MPQTISKIGIKDSSGTGYDTRDIGAKGQNVEVGYDASGKIILDVDTQTPTTTKQLTKVLQDAEKNISDLDDSKAPDNHAWSDADSGVNHGLADGTHYGHIKVGDGLTVNSGKVDVSYGDSANTACQGNDSRLSNARKNPNAITFTDGTTNMSYDGSEAKTVNATTIGAAPSGHTSVQATGSILGHVKTGTGITNNSGTISVSYGTAAGTACQGNDSRLSDSRTPKSHAATATTYGSGTSSNYGHVKLTDTYSVDTPNASTNGANTGIAASAYALQQAYNTLNSNITSVGNHFHSGGTTAGNGCIYMVHNSGENGCISWDWTQGEGWVLLFTRYPVSNTSGIFYTIAHTGGQPSSGIVNVLTGAVDTTNIRNTISGGATGYGSCTIKIGGYFGAVILSSSILKNIKNNVKW